MGKKFNAEKALAGIGNGGVEATTEVQNAPTKVGAKKFNAEKALAGIELETPEDKERVETMMSIGKLNRDLMGGQLQQIGADIPDFTNKWTYDYLMSEEKPSTEVDTEAQMYHNPLAAEEALTPDSVVVGANVQKPLRGANLQDSIKSIYDTENEDFLGTKRATASNLVDKYGVDADGYVTIGDQRMPRAQAEMIMQDVVEQTMHPTMLQKNKAYRDNWFIGNTGMNAEDYLRSIDANLAGLQRELNTEVGKDIDAIRSTTTALQMAENAGIDPATAQSIVTNERYGGKAIRDMRDQIQSILNNDFGSGLKEGFDALSMISAGLNDLVANVELGNVLNKVYNDKPLTEREKIAYEAYMIGEQINELEDLFGGRSWWNEVGQGVGTSAEMAVGFAAGLGAVGKLGKFANLPVRAAIKSVRRAAKSGAWDAIKMAGIRGTQLAGRSLKNVGIAEGAGLIAAPMLPSTYASLAEKRNGQYAVENGRLVFKPTTAWRDVVDTWIESGTEIGSELIGARIGEVLGGSARAFGRMLSLDKLAAKAGIGKHSNILFGWEKPAAFKAFERSVGFQGAVAEPLSEIWGDAAANMLKGIITGNGEFAQFRDADYWTKTLATCAIYGGSLQVASAPHAVARYANITKYGRDRKKALSRIKVAKLHDEVSAALAIDNIDDAAKAFAQIEWGSYSLDQRAYAMDAIRADYAQRVAIANQVEDGRMTQFLHVVDRIEDMEYRGMDGLTPKGFIKTIVDKDGVTYTAIQGGKDKPFYICLDAEGNKISIPTVNIEGERNVALGDVISQQYDSMYSVESEQERQRNIVDRYNDMRKGESSAESVKRIMSLFGVKQYRSGDDVTLVNGETATVEEFIPETGEFIVSLHNGGMETLPFYNVLSESTLTADAQKLNNASTVNANVEQQIDAEERSAEAANEPRATRFVEGDIVVTPTGANARVREVNEDGTYEVDYNTEEEANPSNMILENYAEADLRFENEGVEVASTEVVPQETEVTEIEQTAPESNADATMPEAKPIPQNEDGTINYDAIDDAEQFATLYEREVGGRENATQDVADMRDSAQEDLLKSIEKGKKMRNANEKVANRREQQALAERVAFYNNVLDILAPAEQATSAEETAPVEQTTNEVQTVPSQSAEAEGKQTGLIANEYSEQLTSDFAESLDAVAKAFGLRVMFVHLASEGKANAEIEGNEVRIAWKYRGKAIPFLVGHEFTHRMQDLSPEEYNAFKGAVIKYLGEEEWNARIADIKETYDKQAVAYTDTLIEDEAVADFVGEVIEDADSFDLFIAQNAKEGWFKRFIEALKALFSKLSKTDVKAELYKDMLDKLGAMVSKATEVATEYEAETMRESVMQGQTKFSLSEESIKIFDAAKAKFGTTYDMREAGYILPDGSMLDFSGRHQVEGDASFLNGDRTVDHREIADIAYDNDDNETGIKTDLGDFLDRGAIRIDSNAGAINLNVAPTKAQKDRLKRLIERNDGYVYIDFGKGWDTEHYAEYEAARASRVLGDIDRYFDEGIKPSGNVRFSLSVMRGLSDALNEYKVNGDIATFVENVREVNDKVALGHPMIEIVLALYEEDGDAEWFAEKIAEIVGDYNGGYAPYTAGGARFSLSDISAYQASAELSVRLDSYKAKQITLSELVEAARTISQKYVKAGQIETAVEEYEDGVVNEDEFIYALEGFISIYPPKVLQDFRKEKQTIEETFGGIWIEDRAEFAKFAKAVNNTPFEENGEGIAYTDNYFYAYYRSIDGHPIPFASVYMNEHESQDIVNEILRDGREKKTAREWFDWFNAHARNVKSKNDAVVGSDKKARNTRTNGRLDSELSRYGAYYDSPELFVKSKRTYKGSKVNYSLITPEMDASYLDAVERGDMATAQRMVMEAAKLAMPNTKVVDEDGNPKVVYHGTPNNFNAFSKEMFGTSTDRGIWGNGFYFSDSEQYAKTYEKRGGKQGKTLSVFLNIKRPLFISLRNGGNEGAMYFHELMEKHFTDDIYEDVTRTDELMSVAQERLTADIVANGYDGIVVEYTNHIDAEYVAFEPNQIKSADAVTYDDAGNIIPLSERFNPKKEDIRYSISDAPTFYSNAEYAVRNIKQEKATPEQWLKMIEKAGGLKAGEDKWLGLSDWLKASDKNTLTKDEVLQYIAENDIQIEEVSYGDVADISREEIYESAEFAELREGLTEYDEDDNPYINRERYEELRSESYDFVDGFTLDYWGEELEVDSPAAAATYLGLTKADKEINETRLNYTTQGLSNKREIALTVPTIEPYKQSDNIHFGDAGEGRAVAWVRFGETTDAEGKRVLVIDEIQSKRHQDGREKGYRDVEAEKREKAERERELTEVVLPRLAELNQLYNEKYGVGKWRDTEYDRQWRPRRVYRLLTPEEQAEHEAIAQRATELQMPMPRRSGIPSAPFEKNWAELAFKRMLRYAAENGYDYVAWTTGDQQADRYDIGSVVKDIVAYDTKDADGNPIKKMKFRMNNMGTYNIATNMEGVIVKGDGEMKEGMRLSDITGKALAEKIMNGEGEDAMVFENGKDIEAKSLEGEELHIGNEGMKAFYDQMLPSFVKKYTKKWGAEVGEVTMPDLEENNTMHAVNVTDAMRESVMQGQPRFSIIGEIGAANLEEYGRYGSPMLALEIARELEADGKSALEIRVATNWERGKDGKWRYEIADGEYIHPSDDDITSKEYRLKDILNNPDLYKAYPNFADVKVKYDPNMKGYGMFKRDTITLNSNRDEADIFSALIHEVQHAIQLKEMFAIGGNVAEQTAPFKTDIVALEEETKALAQEFKRTSNIHLLRKGYLLYQGLRRAFEHQMLTDKGYESYRTLAGEVEARNAQKRHNMSEDERLNTLLTATEDVARDSQRVIFHEANVGEISSPRLSVRDADAEGRATEEMVHVYMKRQHQINKANIRKRYKALRDVVKADYAEKRAKRLDKIKSMLSNAGKVDYILGDIAEQTIPYVHQALAKIARGEVRIKWDNSPDGRKRGIASELGAKKGEKRLYASVTNGATLYFDEFVHQWWEELGGYTNDIDTQDLRSALIEALSEASNSNYAIAKLREIYDNDAQQRDEILDSYEREEERELAEEVARYEQEVSDFEANKEVKIAEFEASAAFFDELAAVDETLSEIRTRLAKIEERTKQRVEGVKGTLREMREAVAEVKKLIKETITSKTLASMQRNELRGMLDKLDKARSLADVQAIAVEVENTLLDVQIREKRKDLDKMLQLRLPNGESVEAWVNTQVAEGRMSASDARKVLDDMWRGKNATGVRVSKWIDEGTAKVMNKLRELIQPTLKTKLVEDVNAAERGQYTRKDEELTLNVDGAITQNEERLAELNSKLANQEREGEANIARDQRFTDEDMAEYLARGIYDSYLRSVAYKQDAQFILKGIDEVNMQYYGMADKKGVRDYKIERLREELADAKRKYAQALDDLNSDVLQLMREGKEALSAFRMQQDAHKRMIVNLAHNAIRIEPRLIANPQKVGVMHRVKAVVRGTLNASYWTFQTTLKEIDRLAPNGEGDFYNYFMNAWLESTNKMIRQHSDHCTIVAEAITNMLGIKGKVAAEVIGDAIEQSDAKILGYITYGKGVGADGSIIKEERLPLTVSNIMYIIAMWRQPMYRNSLIKHGIEEQTINSLYDMLNRENPEYITFMNWVNETLLPETRLLYDKVHKEMFGASMAEERNYFPARVVSYQENAEVGKDDTGALPSTITGAIISRKKNALMPDISQNYFKVLMGHLQDMDRWSAYAPLIRDINTLLSNTEFKNACRQYKAGAKADGTGWGDLYDIFRNVSAIALGCYKPKSNPIDDFLMKGLKGWATSNISWRAVTAIKQLASMPIFAVYALDGKMPKIFLKTSVYAFAHPKETIQWAREMSPSFQKRWDSGFAGMDILNTKIGEENGKADLAERTKSKWYKGAKAFDDAITKFAVDWGMTPNKAVDAFAVAVGLKAVYEYELQRMMKAEGNTTPTEAQKNEALKKAEVAFNATQQSSEGAYLSTVQANRTVLLRGWTVYMNSVFAFHRLLLTSGNEYYKQLFDKEYKSVNDKESLKVARGKAFAQVAQSAAGTFLFALMGEGIKELFLLCAGGEDDGEEYNTVKETLWWATATMLGGGFVGGGAAISALQGYNTSLTPAWDDLAKTAKRLWNAEWPSVEAGYEAFNIISRFHYGVDLDTFMNIAKGIDGLVEQTGNTEALMQILNAPQSQINLVAGMRREGENVMDYVTRIMRIKSLFFDPKYEDVYNEKDSYIGAYVLDNDPHKIRNYEAKKLHSEYDEARMRNVVTRLGERGELAAMEETDAEYTKKAKSLNWSAGSAPSHTQNVIRGEYRAPIDDLTKEGYFELTQLQQGISYLTKNMKGFAGSDEVYYDMAKILDNLKQKFNSKYDELIK